MAKPTELDKLKTWLDMEITILHIMFYVVIWLLTHNLVAHIILAVFIVYSVLYLVSRGVYMASIDKNYLKIPK